MLSIIQLCYQTFMDYFGMMMDLAEDSSFLMLLVSCTMAVAFILNVESGRAVFQAVGQTVANRRIRARLNRYPSPVHIASRKACRRQLKLPLVWKHYDDPPQAMLLENNGSTVVLRICCSPDAVPHLSGGQLDGSYQFVEAIFKWGEKRTEHSMDKYRTSMEMQVLHRCPEKKGTFEYLALSYLFSFTSWTNGPLQEISENLNCIQWPGSSIELPPFELVTLFRPFDMGYYTYQGTYDNGEVELPVTWLIDLQLAGIRSHQAAEFLALCRKDGSRIRSNARLEQSLGSRKVLLVS